jgi:hypothetical protein
MNSQVWGINCFTGKPSMDPGFRRDDGECKGRVSGTLSMDPRLRGGDGFKVNLPLTQPFDGGT